MTEEVQSLRVCVVCHTADHLRSFCAWLVRAKMTVMAFPGAETALEALNRREAPDLIVTELEMPGIDGWRFARLLRSPEYGALNSVPIMVVSAAFSGDAAIQVTMATGANYLFALPTDEAGFVEAVKILADGSLPLRRPRVLIVEDEALISEVLELTLTSHGYVAEIAGTFHSAVEKYRSGLHELAILDGQLPDGDGSDLLTEFRALNPQGVLIMMTGTAWRGATLEWMKRGAAAVVRKPCAPLALIELCQRCAQ